MKNSECNIWALEETHEGCEGCEGCEGVKDVKDAKDVNGKVLLITSFVSSQ